MKQEPGHRYTFGYRGGGQCSTCGSPNHWALHCPEDKDDLEES